MIMASITIIVDNFYELVSTTQIIDPLCECEFMNLGFTENDVILDEELESKIKNLKEELKALSVPVLFLYGTRDRLATAEYGQSLGKSCELIQGANHFMLPLVPETRKVLVNWLISRQRLAAN